MIRVENLTKTFRDRKRGTLYAARDVSFECRAGEVYGLLGPNGAGKTTVLRVISTAIRPTSGSATVMGHDVVRQPRAASAAIGFLSANVGLYGRLTPRETLRFFGRLYGIADPEIARRTEELSRTFQMEEFLDRPCDKLSLGMKQKVNIARSLVHSPPVVILDEPTAGLDVLTSRSIITFVRQCREEGRTVVLSTHIMREVERLCDRVGIIHQGMMKFEGTIAELRASHEGDLEDAFVRFASEESP